MAELVLGLAKSTVEGTLTLAKTAMEDEKKLHKSVQRDLMLISDEFEMMHSFLNVAKDDHVTDDVTGTLVRQVRNMALDAEDCIESVVQLDNKPGWWRRMLPSCMPAAAPAADLDDAVAGMELLKTRVEATGQRNMRYSHIISSNSNSKPPATNKLQEAGVTTAINATASNGSDIAAVGPWGAGEEDRSSPVSSFIKSINREEDILRVISVFGTVGTMSIVKEMYDNVDLGQVRFRAWVKLMRPFNPHEFIRSLMMAQFDCLDLKEVTASGGEEKLLAAFMEKINKARYLIVLEDVCSMVEWEAVRVYLPDKKNGSCIIVTTHLLEVASLCVGYPHQVVVHKFVGDHSVRVFFNEDAGPVRVEHTDDNYWMRTHCKISSEKQRRFARIWPEIRPLFGREVDLSYLREDISNESGKVRSVWGMSGVGKSYLIRHVYYKLHLHDESTSPGIFGWVEVSRPFNLEDLSRRLLLDLNDIHSFPYEYISEKSLRHIPPTRDLVQECREHLLHEHLRQIVIDGLQTTEEWDLIKAAWGLESLMRSGGASIIVISNEESVAKYCASHDELVYNVRGLEAEYAIQLFQEVQGKKQGSGPDDQEWHELLHKCGGLPKVICAVAMNYGRLEASKKGNLVSAFEDNNKVMLYNLEDLLAWFHSYFSSCPDFLKPCIFYLTIFPLNHTIRRRRLVRRWIAEGYSRDKKQSTAEEDGEMSFNKLVNLSMIQVPSTTIMTDKRVPLCQFNGFIREYIISRSMEENLVFALEGNCSRNVQRTGRHLVIDESWDRDRSVFESIDFTRLRSLTVFGKWKPFFISDKMRLLRVLDLEDASSGDLTNDHVEQIVKLLPRLKFFSLRGRREISRLPDSLGADLKQLQTLDIRGTSVTNLPKSIVDLEKLQYIRAGTTVTMVAVPVGGDAGMPPPPAAGGMAESPSSSSLILCRPRATHVPNWLSKLCGAKRDDGSHNGVKVPRGIGKLSSLHTLGVVNISAAGKEDALEFDTLAQLHKIGVSGVNGVNRNNFFKTISDLAHLESLSIMQVQLMDEDNDDQADCLGCISDKTIENLRSLKLYGLTRKLPVWTKKLQNLRKLSLQMTVLPKEGIDAIAELPKLEKLSLFLSEFQQNKLELAKFNLDIFEISCNSSLQATISFQTSRLKVLRFRCWGVSSLQISGLQNVNDLKELWLSAPFNAAHKEHFNIEVNNYKAKEGESKPVFRLEEPGNKSTPWLMTSS